MLLINLCVPWFVAGPVDPTGDIWTLFGNLSHIDVVEIFHKQAEGQKAGGVDVLWLETISSTKEFIAAAENFYRADMAWCKTVPKSL